MTNGSPLFDYTAASGYLQVSRSKLERLVGARHINHRKSGARVFFTQADLDDYIASTLVAATTTAATTTATRRAARVGGPNLSVIGRTR